MTVLSIANDGAVTDDVNTTADKVTVTYVANEGVFVSDGTSGVLIDALFGEGVEGYARLAPNVLEQMETAKPPYDTVRLVLVTHRHRDHFNAASIVRHLEHNPGAMLVAPANAAELVEDAAKDFDTIRDRTRFHTPPPGETAKIEHAGLTVESFFVSHGSGRFAKVHNLGHIVTIGGKRVLHLGDAELDEGAFGPVRTFAKNIDIACVPYWWLISKAGRDFVAEALPRAHLIAVHIEPSRAEKIVAGIQRWMPDAIAFTEPNQKASY